MRRCDPITRATEMSNPFVSVGDAAMALLVAGVVAGGAGAGVVDIMPFTHVPLGRVSPGHGCVVQWHTSCGATIVSSHIPTALRKSKGGRGLAFVSTAACAFASVSKHALARYGMLLLIDGNIASAPLTPDIGSLQPTPGSNCILGSLLTAASWSCSDSS